MARQGFATGKRKLQVFAMHTSIATGTTVTLKDNAGTTVTMSATDQLVIFGAAVGDAVGAGGTFQLQTVTNSQPILVVVGPSSGGGGIAHISPEMPNILPVGSSVKYVGTANGFVNLFGYVLR